MESDPIDPSKKRFFVCIDEIQQNFVFGDEFSGRYAKTVTLSNGSTRTIELTPMIHDGRPVIEFKDTGGLTYMGLNGTTTNGNLMVQIRDFDAMEAQRTAEDRQQVVLPPDVSLPALDGFIPQGFTDGIEILNDVTTPMDFVVEVLQKYVGLDKASSVRTMLAIHYRGGVLLPFDSREIANRVADSITIDAQQRNHNLICRAVSV